MNTLLRYNPNTGVFTWLANRNIQTFAGDVAGSIKKDGYIAIGVNKKYYKAHRLAWLFTYGVWPTSQIDHINGDRTDNRIVNLRESTSAQNHQNRKLPKTNTSGYMGVYKDVSGKWAARIRIAPTRVFLGLFDTPEQAAKAYTLAKANLHTFNPEVRSC